MNTAIVHVQTRLQTRMRMQASARPRAPARGRSIAIAMAALTLACGGAQAQPRGGYHGGYHGGGVYYRGGWGSAPLWGAVGLGLGLSLARPYYYESPGIVVVDQPPPVYYPPAYAPVPVYSPPPPMPVAAPDPVFYPRKGQNNAQLEADRQDCNRWATTQPAAMAEASVFQRATLACMDARGYTSR
ncbi:MAG: hypothetical protein ABW032_09765 [Burkholderiaceae bacterium]